MSEFPIDPIVWIALFILCCGLGIAVMVLLLGKVAAFAETISYFLALLFALSLIPHLKYSIVEFIEDPKLLFDDLYLSILVVGGISAFWMTGRSLRQLRRAARTTAELDPESAPVPAEEPEEQEEPEPQAPATPEPAPEPEVLPGRTKRLIFAVNDLAATVKFYRKAFGWTQISFRDDMVEFELPDETSLGLLKVEVIEQVTSSTVHQPTATQIRGAQLYLRVDNLQKATKRLADAGGRLLSEATLRDWGDIVAYYADPNDNVIALSIPGRT